MKFYSNLFCPGHQSGADDGKITVAAWAGAVGLASVTSGMLIMPESNAHPQGAKVFNGKTHQVFGPQYISKVEGGKLVVQHKTAIEDGFYDDEVDYTTQPL